jgi:exopolyphosphatase/guanosine-5'-triphosphate,3'-diphosphate pyrophosphatase
MDTHAGFADELRRYPDLSALRAVATSAVRDAVNGPEFCATVLETTGIHLEVIDGAEEGLLTLCGVRAGIVTEREHLLVFDVGGGSTEYTLATATAPLFTESLPLGVVRLTEGKGSCSAMADKIDRELAALSERMTAASVSGYLANAELVATAGTATTLADAEVQAIFNRLLPLSPAERLQVKGLEPGREDLIIAGILLTLRTMERFGFTQLKVSDFGLLEGILLSVAGQGPAKVLM